MTRDIEDRIRHFLWIDALRAQVEEDGGEEAADGGKRAGGVWERIQDAFQVNRLGLNYDQVEQYGPPPNPAKVTDSRAKGYMAIHGRESWELDALEPQVLADLIEDAVLDLRDEGEWAEGVEREEAERTRLTKAAERWHEVVALLDAEEDE